MEKLSLSQLQAGEPLVTPLYHSSGEVLLNRGKLLSPELLGMLEEAGITEVLVPGPGEDVGRFVHHAKNWVLLVDELKTGQRTSQPIYDRGGALLIDSGAMVNERMATSLKRRGVDEVYVRKTTVELALGQVQAFRRAMRSRWGTRPAPVPVDLGPERCVAPEECTPESIDRLLEVLGDLGVQRTGTPLHQEIKARDPMVARSAEAKRGFTSFYEDALAVTEEIFRAFQTGSKVDERRIGGLAAEVVGGLIEDRDLLLNLPNMKTEHNYLLGHSMGVTVLCAAAASAMGYSRAQVLGMAFAAYLHDIGMLRVPAQILSKPGGLTSDEMMQVRHHPVHSLNMLQSLSGRRSGIPLFVPVVTYQSHERDDGSGYPKGRRGKVIHEFSRIMAVCDAFEAMTSRRPWRQGLLPYRAMEELISGASRGVYDRRVVKALLSYVSLFPIGSWVELTDGSCARVVAVTQSDYARPVVAVMHRDGQRLAEPVRVNLAAPGAPAIARPVPPPEGGGDLMEGF